MDNFLSKAKSIYQNDDYLSIEYAFNYAREAHAGQKRVSGEEYFIHPVAVAYILMDLGLDQDSIIAALLHDVIEDTGVAGAEIKQKFGQNIFEMVEGVTKLTRINVKSIEEEQAENIRKLFLAMSKDIRVLLIKLADRLHNMRTLQYLPAYKQQKKARETLDIFAPLAGRLGIGNIKTELEDLSMKYIYPEEYKFLIEKLNMQRDKRMVLVNRVQDEIENQIKDLNMKYEIKGRPKHFYSIFNKMRNQGKTFDQIYDLIAVRVVLEDIRDCYTVLGIIHSIWKPVPGRFKDYIAMAKPNMYQSLHTTVVTNFGQIFEIQIRTFEMNRIAEYGIAAHWKYKEGKGLSEPDDMDKKLGWIKEVMDVQGDLKDSLEFIDTLKLNVSTNEIYVFSPKGAVFDLQSGSTCVDFAYRVHSAVGDQCVGAKVNNRIVHLNHVLENGDMVEILTNKASKGPSRDWLKFVVTPSAKAKINSFFRKAFKEENIKIGKEMLVKEAKRRGYALSDLMVPSWVGFVIDRYRFSSIEDMYASVGYGSITTNKILLKLIDYYRKDKASKMPDESNLDELKSDVVKKPTRRAHSGIIVEGYDDFLIKISHCCNPVPGDDIIGFVSRGRGIIVHKKDCPNMQNQEKNRLLSAKWATDSNSKFVTNLYIECDNVKGILAQMTVILSNLNINISNLTIRTDKQSGLNIIVISVEIKSKEELGFAIKKLSTVQGIHLVNRGS